ncbi:MAG: acyl-CoA/acyl-ACP dehydrogenase, partial [Candidatus Hydrogenedentes bacterium]|nr:acyl-CoA/acyl-ACP dehydrogenase [Candidatus Hydrogenedentota bacterium]
ESAFSRRTRETMPMRHSPRFREHRQEVFHEEADIAKLRAAEAGFEACDTALQTHGGMGYAKEFHVERLWREVRLFRIAPVSQEMALNYIGQHVLGLPKSY